MSQNINLYDDTFRTRRDWLSAKVAGIGISVAALAIASAALVLHSQVERLDQQARTGEEQLKSQQTALQDLAKQVAGAQPDTRLLSDLSAAQSSLEQRRSALQLLNAGGLGNLAGYSPTLQAFARQSKSGLWLTGITLNHRDIALRGRALSPELVPIYLLRLNHEEALQGRSFRALEIQRPLESEKAVTGVQPNATAAMPRSASYVEFALASAEGIAAPGAPDGKP
jgi:cell division protein FtsL